MNRHYNIIRNDNIIKQIILNLDKEGEPTVLNVQKILGSGSSGCVYDLLDINNNNFYCAKEVKKSKKSFITNELAVLESIRHENIIDYYGAIEDEMAVIILLEKGIGDISTIIKHNRIEKKLCLKYICEIANALKELHRNNIIHRDVKLSNMVITGNNVAKLIDFSVSSILNEEGFMKGAVGTYYCMSPHLQAQKDYTCKADVWSLGIALFEIITVERPFKGRKKEEYYLSIHKPIEYPDFVKNEKDLIYIIELMLRVEQDERPTIDFIIEQLYLVINVNNNMETLMRKYNLTYNEILSYSYQSNFNLTRLEESFNGNTSNSE